MTTSVSQAKAELRRTIRPVLKALSPADIAQRSLHVCEHLDCWLDAAVHALPVPGVMIFAPMPAAGEVDLTLLVERRLARQWAVYLPRLDALTRRMTPVRIHDLAADTVLDAARVPVPRPDLPEADDAPLAAIIMPGLAFDTRGGRLGRGMGYYDRFVAPRRIQDPTLRLIGAVFHEQIVDHVPMEPHDQPVDAIATDQGVIDAAPIA